MTKFQRYALLGSALFGLVTIALGVIMLFVFPAQAELTDGFRTPIIAFEFARTEADLAFLAGGSELSQLNRAKMNAGHAWDTVFPFAYAGFIVFLLLQIAQRARGLVSLGLLLAALIVPFDLYENAVLLQIILALESAASVSTLLSELHLATWLKWGALGMSLAVLSVGFVLTKSYGSALFSSLAAASVAGCWLSDSQPNLTELMSVLIFVFFLALTISRCVQSWRLIRQAV